jgi:membrane protease YdiL (CAAX protease family)
MPVRNKVSVLSISIAASLVIPAVLLVDFERRSIELTALGLLFILSIGFGEEMLVRGFLFGFLERHGQYFALICSSMIFGLLHLNRYQDGNWDGWRAYSLVLTASSMGLFMCALMLVTKSIWVSVIFHALANWSLAFKSVEGKEVELVSQSLLGTLFDPFLGVVLYSTLAFFILWMNSEKNLSPRITTFLNRLNLVENESTDQLKL